MQQKTKENVPFRWYHKDLIDLWLYNVAQISF